VLLVLGLAVGLGCQSTPEQPDFEDLPSAEELYATGLEKLELQWWMGVFPRVDYNGAIEDFQSIIDNYPYSEFAVKSELRLADAYFADQRYEEALSKTFVPGLGRIPSAWGLVVGTCI